MTEVGGGEVAAFGLNYQYLLTVEHFLMFLRDNPEQIPRTVLVVEPLLQKADGDDDDIVDFGIEVDGETIHNTQVKSSLDPDTYPLQPAPAREIFGRLLDQEAKSALLLTNKPLSPVLSEESVVGATLEKRTYYTWPDGPQNQVDGGMPPQIVVDTRRPVEIRDSIAQIVRQFRKDRALKQGIISSNILVSILVDYIFAVAAGQAPNRISALDLLETLAMPDARIAHVAGGADWGLPITNIPNYISTVMRLDYLDEIRSGLSLNDSATEPGRVVLTGQTGNGKTVIASDYCHAEAISYEFICWIDCREVDLIEPQIRNIFSQLRCDEPVPKVGIGSVFAAMLGRQKGPWLLVFDGIQDRRDIEAYIPSAGYGSIIVTTNNSLNWWPTAQITEVRELTEDEAVDCFAIYAGLTPAEINDARESIVGIVDRLGRIALAVSMSGVYFKNTEGQVNELAPQYFSELEALSDDQAIPPGFNQTAFAAIQHAVRRLGKGTEAGDSARAVVEIGALLAPELLPLNLTLLATERSVSVNLAELPRPAEFDQVKRRAVLTALRTQTIARRVVNDGDGSRTPVSETVAIHPLVHEILQRSYLDEVPPGHLESQCAVFMYFLVGWLGVVRDQGEFFAVEQLRLHANALLQLIADNEPLTSLGPQNRRVFSYVKALLEAELSTCAANRGRLQEAVRLGLAAAKSLSPYLTEPPARGISMKILADILSDLSMGEVPPEQLLTIATPLLAACREAESSQNEGIRAYAYVYAGEAVRSLSRIEIYRGSPMLVSVRGLFTEIVARDPAGDASNAAQDARINSLYDAGQFEELLAFIEPLIEENRSQDNAIMLEAVRIVCQLHTGPLEEVTFAINDLVGRSPHGNYLLLSLSEALKKIGRELHRVIQAQPGLRERIQPVLDRVLARYYELVELAGGGPPPP